MARAKHRIAGYDTKRLSQNVVGGAQRLPRRGGGEMPAGGRKGGAAVGARRGKDQAAGRLCGQGGVAVGARAQE